MEYLIDGKDETAWATDVGPGRSNVPRKAVFVFEEPVSFPKGAVLTFQLTQNHGGWNSDDNQNNNLGRFRFSVTDEPNAVADPLPANVRALLAVPAKRTPAQVEAVFAYWRTTMSEWKEANAKIEALWRSTRQGRRSSCCEHRTTARDARFEARRLPEAGGGGGAGRARLPAPLAGPPGQAGGSPNRLDFAKWLADRNSPTTARVAGQPRLAGVLRHRHRRHAGGLRHPGRQAVAPRIARLAGRGVHGAAVGAARSCTS